MLIEGGPTTVTLAEPVLPDPNSLELTVLVVSLCAPAVTPLTVTARVQDALAASVAPVRLTELVPAVAVAVPPQVLVGLVDGAITKPLGRVSVNPTPVIEIAELLLVIVKVKLVVPFSGIEVAPKAAAKVGGVPTDSVAVAVLPVPPVVDVT